ncbi:hypothetical protein I316_02505 [Kwoniella heveanensis BCC8398]|uniref:Glutathione S-transferase n=1 Tax=Kwoniella heveanensis BCC8398 TaxID=1296120 RepID=A0A1B9GYD1_9TREE|nr:hypothetical protein I316_02505 [Kwoniella heveanensis BCC8398]
MSSQTPEILLYTNHGCPFAGRVHIALSALNLPYSEEIIPLDKPRTEEYLKINPRGKVPAIKYNGSLLTESGIIANFLADAHPGLLPSSPIERARLNFISDAWGNFALGPFFKIFFAKTEQDAEAAAKDFVDIVVKEVEPAIIEAKKESGKDGLWAGGNDNITIAEVFVGPFLLRLFSYTDAGFAPSSLLSDLEKRAPNFYAWAQNARTNAHVRAIYNEETIIASIKRRRDDILAKA